MEILDTTFLIDFVDGKIETKDFDFQGELYTTQINMYEFICGLFFSKPSDEESDKILSLLGDIRVFQMSDESIIRAADIFVELYKKGKMINESDLHIAGIALANGTNKIVTRNVKDFKNIKGLEVVEY